MASAKGELVSKAEKGIELEENINNDVDDLTAILQSLTNYQEESARNLHNIITTSITKSPLSSVDKTQGDSTLTTQHDVNTHVEEHTTRESHTEHSDYKSERNSCCEDDDEDDEDEEEEDEDERTTTTTTGSEDKEGIVSNEAREAENSILEAMRVINQFTTSPSGSNNLQEQKSKVAVAENPQDHNRQGPCEEDEEIVVELRVKHRPTTPKVKFDIDALNNEVAYLLSLVGEPVNTSQMLPVVGATSQTPPPTPTPSLTSHSPHTAHTLHAHTQAVPPTHTLHAHTYAVPPMPKDQTDRHSLQPRPPPPPLKPHNEDHNTLQASHLSRSLGSLAAAHPQEPTSPLSHHQDPPLSARSVKGREGSGFFSTLRAMGVKEGMRSLKKRNKKSKNVAVQISGPQGFRHLAGTSLQSFKIQEAEDESEEDVKAHDNIRSNTTELSGPVKAKSLSNIAMPSD